MIPIKPNVGEGKLRIDLKGRRGISLEVSSKKFRSVTVSARILSNSLSATSAYRTAIWYLKQGSRCNMSHVPFLLRNSRAEAAILSTPGYIRQPSYIAILPSILGLFPSPPQGLNSNHQACVFPFSCVMALWLVHANAEALPLGPYGPSVSSSYRRVFLPAYFVVCICTVKTRGFQI